uniref:Uncharacterized protein n=1 Tax=Ciona savignyi TaxID=51511 RepID=H2YEK2_CIOSA
LPHNRTDTLHRQLRPQLQPQPAAPVVVVQQQQQQQQQQGGGGGGLGCRRCGAIGLKDEFTCCGVCLAIWFFPLGLICCFMMREKKCAGCGAAY